MSSQGDRPVASWPLRCDGRRGERSLTAVSVMSVGVQAGAAELPRLEAFDEEFGPEPATALPEPRRRTGLRFWAWLVVMVAAGSVGALALLWPTSDAGSLLQGLSAATAPRTASRGGDEQVDRLMREVAALRRQVRDLSSAQQEAADALAAARATESRGYYWYSNLAALNFGIASRPEPGVVEPPSGRPATVRARPGDVRRRETGTGAAPMSLEPPD